MSFTDLIELAAERFGSAVIVANDEFFAPKDALLLPTPPVWIEGKYTERGKWMDGWETRRRREAGHDWCIIRLGAPGIVRGVVVDTSWFTGNFPPECSLDGCSLNGVASAEQLMTDSTPWWELLPRSPLEGNRRNEIAVRPGPRVTHLRLNIFPDGGVARLRVHGDVVPEPARLSAAGAVDLSAAENGGFVVLCSDMHYGHRQNMIMPGRSTFMGDGWETKRRRGPGHEWSIVRLAAPGRIDRVEIDTDHYKGNAPGSFSLDGCDTAGATLDAAQVDSRSWTSILARTPLQPHSRHILAAEGPATTAFTHARLNIFPDGGIARLRLFGTPRSR